LKFEFLSHPAYSPNFAPSDYHILGPLKDMLHGCQFANDEEVKDMVYVWLHAQPKTFYADDIRKLVD
jgi:hypothetical protein